MPSRASVREKLAKGQRLTYEEEGIRLEMEANPFAEEIELSEVQLETIFGRETAATTAAAPAQQTQQTFGEFVAQTAQGLLEPTYRLPAPPRVQGEWVAQTAQGLLEPTLPAPPRVQALPKPTAPAPSRMEVDIGQFVKQVQQERATQIKEMEGQISRARAIISEETESHWTQRIFGFPTERTQAIYRPLRSAEIEKRRLLAKDVSDKSLEQLYQNVTAAQQKALQQRAGETLRIEEIEQVLQEGSASIEREYVDIDTAATIARAEEAYLGTSEYKGIGLPSLDKRTTRREIHIKAQKEAQKIAEQVRTISSRHLMETQTIRHPRGVRGAPAPPKQIATPTIEAATARPSIAAETRPAITAPIIEATPPPQETVTPPAAVQAPVAETRPAITAPIIEATPQVTTNHFSYAGMRRWLAPQETVTPPAAVQAPVAAVEASITAPTIEPEFPAIEMEELTHPAVEAATIEAPAPAEMTYQAVEATPTIEPEFPAIEMEELTHPAVEAATTQAPAPAEMTYQAIEATPTIEPEVTVGVGEMEGMEEFTARLASLRSYEVTPGYSQEAYSQAFQRGLQAPEVQALEAEVRAVLPESVASTARPAIGPATSGRQLAIEGRPSSVPRSARISPQEISTSPLVQEASAEYEATTEHLITTLYPEGISAEELRTVMPEVIPKSISETRPIKLLGSKVREAIDILASSEKRANIMRQALGKITGRKSPTPAAEVTAPASETAAEVGAGPTSSTVTAEISAEELPGTSLLERSAFVDDPTVRTLDYTVPRKLQRASGRLAGKNPKPTEPRPGFKANRLEKLFGVRSDPAMEAQERGVQQFRNPTYSEEELEMEPIEIEAETEWTSEEWESLIGRFERLRSGEFTPARSETSLTTRVKSDTSEARSLSDRDPFASEYPEGRNPFIEEYPKSPLSAEGEEIEMTTFRSARTARAAGMGTAETAETSLTATGEAGAELATEGGIAAGTAAAEAGTEAGIAGAEIGAEIGAEATLATVEAVETGLTVAAAATSWIPIIGEIVAGVMLATDIALTGYTIAEGVKSSKASKASAAALALQKSQSWWEQSEKARKRKDTDEEEGDFAASSRMLRPSGFGFGINVDKTRSAGLFI